MPDIFALGNYAGMNTEALAEARADGAPTVELTCNRVWPHTVKTDEAETATCAEHGAKFEFATDTIEDIDEQ